MSLFGTSPDEPSLDKPSLQRQSKSLFNDGARPTSVSNNSLFADSEDTNGDSPWAMPAPKKAARSEVIKNLLQPSDVPKSYVDAYDAILDSGDRTSGNVSKEVVSKILQSSGIGSDEQTSILNLVAPGGVNAGLERSAFNVLMALLGLAQEGEDATLDGVDERRKS